MKPHVHILLNASVKATDGKVEKVTGQIASGCDSANEEDRYRAAMHSMFMVVAPLN